MSTKSASTWHEILATALSDAVGVATNTLVGLRFFTHLIAASIVIDFLIGIFIIWLYAAIRPRYGAGPETAIITGLAVWFICLLIGWGSTAFTVYPCELVRVVIVAGLAEFHEVDSTLFVQMA